MKHRDIVRKALQDKDTKAKKRIMCPACGRPKLQFETSKKSEDFILWNEEELLADKPEGTKLSCYWCEACGCWHVTSRLNPKRDKNIEYLIDAWKRTKRNRKIKLGGIKVKLK